MPLFDIYQIENWNGGEPTPWFMKLLPVVTTILGFLLGMLPGYFARRRNKKRQGKLFNEALKTLERGLEEQIVEIQRYRKEFLDPIPSEELESLAITILHSTEVIKSLDKTVIIEFFEDDGVLNAALFVNSLYQMFGIVDRDAERLDKVYTEYQAKFDEMIDSYLDEINSLRVLAITERDKLEGKVDSDPFLEKLYSLAFTKKKNFSGSEIIKFAKELHPMLSKEPLFMDTAHPLYKPVLEFSMAGARLVYLYENKKQYYLGLLNMSEATFQSAHKQLKAA